MNTLTGLLLMVVVGTICFFLGIKVSTKEEGWKREAMVDGAKIAIKRINADHKKAQDRLIAKIKQLNEKGEL